MTKEQIKGLQAVTRRIFCNLLQQGRVTKEDKKIIQSWNKIELEIYQKWQDQGLSKLKEKGLIFLYIQLAQNDDMVKNHPSIAKRANESADIATVAETIEYLIKQKKKFYQKATKSLTQNDGPELLIQIAATVDERMEEKKEIKRSLKAVKKAINECMQIFDNGKIPPTELLIEALHAEASANNDIYNKQVSLVTKTYIVVDKKNILTKDVPDDLKKITFDYICGCAKHASYLHVNLINYIFLNEVITEAALQLLEKIKPELVKCGMAILPYANAQTIVNTKKLLNKKNLTNAEKRLIKVMELYDPRIESIH